MTEVQQDVLRTTLQLAVPMWIHEMRPWSIDQRLSMARECAEVVASHGDDLQYGGKHCADTFNKLACGLACLAHQPGGVKFLGYHWIVDQAADPGGRLTKDFREVLERLDVKL